jgi:ABC-type dipeptide/oligopeptide/nickel transport system permease component
MHFLKRIASLFPLLLFISFLAFALVRLTPGSPFDRERKPASPEIERAIQAKYHLDEPFLNNTSVTSAACCRAISGRRSSIGITASPTSSSKRCRFP